MLACLVWQDENHKASTGIIQTTLPTFLKDTFLTILIDILWEPIVFPVIVNYLYSILIKISF